MAHIYDKLPYDVQEIILKYVFEEEVKENTYIMMYDFEQNYNKSEKEWEKLNKDFYAKIELQEYIISPNDIISYKNKPIWHPIIRLDCAMIENEFYEYTYQYDPLGEDYCYFLSPSPSKSLTYSDMAIMINEHINAYLDFVKEEELEIFQPEGITMYIYEITLTPYKEPEGEIEYLHLDFKIQYD
jgi:hypothetical protein